jgi:RNA polymerase sigma-70 factor (ECF subfamily)
LRTEKEKALDTYLAAAARTGDRQALDRLAQRWHPKLLAHAHRLTGERQLAADSTQEAWTDILRDLPSLDNAAAFPAWAFRIVSRRCARSIRGRQRHRAGQAALAREEHHGAETDNAPETQSELATIGRAIDELPRQQRAVLALFYTEGLRVAEIAAAMDIAPGTVKTRLMHAREKLRARLEGETK